MKTSRYTDSQTLNVLKQAENGIPVTELCREMAKETVKGEKLNIRQACETFDISQTCHCYDWLANICLRAPKSSESCNQMALGIQQ